MCSCYVVLLFYLIGVCYALNCRSNGGPKEDDLRTIYNNCLKRQEGKNTSDFRGYSDDDWRDPRGHNQRSQFDKRDRYGGRDSNDRYNGRMNRDDMGSRDDRMNPDDRNRMSSDRYNRDDRMRGNDRNVRDDMGKVRRMNVRNNMMGSRDDKFTDRDQMGGRDDFENSDEYGDTHYNSYSSTPSSRRFRRDRRSEMNSGQRSQYNPNTQKSSGKERSYGNERNSTYNSSKGDDKACALHCFLDNLEMTGDSGMPDKYLVTHAITKDVQNEDLRDFLQESIEECFQILDNENTEDKCEFSKNLLLCLSEKGRANCDDWKDDIKI